MEEQKIETKELKPKVHHTPGGSAFFISGEYDYNCPWVLVQEYCDELDAPDKGFFKIKNSAHSPLWENAKDSMEIMKQIKEKTENGR